ncbi:MAG: hypothetical protein AB1391_04075 [Candidatus Micrarchaeota archaeon]
MQVIKKAAEMVNSCASLKKTYILYPYGRNNGGFGVIPNRIDSTVEYINTNYNKKFKEKFDVPLISDIITTIPENIEVLPYELPFQLGSIFDIDEYKRIIYNGEKANVSSLLEIPIFHTGIIICKVIPSFNGTNIIKYTKELERGNITWIIELSTQLFNSMNNKNSFVSIHDPKYEKNFDENTSTYTFHVKYNEDTLNIHSSPKDFCLKYLRLSKDSYLTTSFYEKYKMMKNAISSLALGINEGKLEMGLLPMDVGVGVAIEIIYDTESDSYEA